MLLTTFWVDYPILGETLSRAPDIKLTWERSDLTEGGDHQILVWADGDGSEAFERGLEVDPTVATLSQVVEFDDRRLYQLELTPEGHRASVYPNVIEQGGVSQEVTATCEGWYFCIAFPGNEAVERFHNFFLKQGLDVEIRQLYEKGESVDRPQSQFGVTERQREALVTALEAGYLDIPRSCSLAELGDRLGISPNATSERFRRGVRSLVENTVSPDGGSPS